MVDLVEINDRNNIKKDVMNKYDNVEKEIIKLTI